MYGGSRLEDFGAVESVRIAAGLFTISVAQNFSDWRLEHRKLPDFDSIFSNSSTSSRVTRQIVESTIITRWKSRILLDSFV